jgi:hypothetical protein
MQIRVLLHYVRTVGYLLTLSVYGVRYVTRELPVLVRYVPVVEPKSRIILSSNQILSCESLP